MKRCKNITCWTDYPMKELGDIPGKPAPIRRVTVIDFDLDKYAYVRTKEGHEESVKAGYLYREQGRCGIVKPISFRKLERGVYVQ